MRIVVIGVCFVAGFQRHRKTMHRHIHQAQLCVVFDLFLTVESHGVGGLFSGSRYKIAALDKHTAAAAGRVKQYTLFRLDDIDDHFDKGFRRKEHTVIRCDILCKLIEEIFVYPPENISAHIIERRVIENTQKLL